METNLNEMDYYNYVGDVFEAPIGVFKIVGYILAIDGIIIRKVEYLYCCN